METQKDDKPVSRNQRRAMERKIAKLEKRLKKNLKTTDNSLESDYPRFTIPADKDFGKNVEFKTNEVLQTKSLLDAQDLIQDISKEYEETFLQHQREFLQKNPKKKPIFCLETYFVPVRPREEWSFVIMDAENVIHTAKERYMAHVSIQELFESFMPLFQIAIAAFSCFDRKPRIQILWKPSIQRLQIPVVDMTQEQKEKFVEQTDFTVCWLCKKNIETEDESNLFDEELKQVIIYLNKEQKVERYPQIFCKNLCRIEYLRRVRIIGSSSPMQIFQVHENPTKKMEEEEEESKVEEL